MKNILLSILLVISANSLIAQDELPAISKNNKNSFFIPEAILKIYNLEIGQQDKWMKVYNNFSDTASIQRVNDIRWQADSKESASNWYHTNTKLLSEGGKDLTSQMPKPVGVNEWNAYGGNENLMKMMEAMGIKQGQFCFTFTVEQYVAKIFIATSEKETIEDAWKLAKEGLRATLIAAGKKTIAGLLL